MVDLLTRGFAVRSRHHWQRALMTLKLHPTPGGFPKFGYLLESGGTPVGVILLIFSNIPAANGCRTRCNISSWYVEPEFRAYASMLISQAIKYKDVTYVNISPAKHTRRIIEAQGFSRYSNGQFVCVPALNMTCADSDARVTVVDVPPTVQFGSSEHDLLSIHKAHGCLSLWCETPTGVHPFVFMPRLIKGAVACAQLIYCRDIHEFVRFARPVGRYLTARGRPFVIIDSNGPIRDWSENTSATRHRNISKGPTSRGSAIWLIPKS